MATRALVNARVLVDDGFRDDLAVLLDDGGDIAALVPAGEARARAGEVEDLAGGWLVPGFIDAQVNGGGGVLFNNDTSVEAIAAIGRAHRRFGTTGFLPTLISDDAEVMARAIDATRAAIAAGVPGVLGVHLEGPYIAPARKGTHDAGKFRVPDVAEVAMATSLDNGVTLITLGILQYIAPTLQFLIGVFVYKEPFSHTQLIGFSVIWLALVIYTGDAIVRHRQRQRQRPLSADPLSGKIS